MHSDTGPTARQVLLREADLEIKETSPCLQGAPNRDKKKECQGQVPEKQAGKEGDRHSASELPLGRCPVHSFLPVPTRSSRFSRHPPPGPFLPTGSSHVLRKLRAPTSPPCFQTNQTRTLPAFMFVLLEPSSSASTLAHLYVCEAGK